MTATELPICVCWSCRFETCVSVNLHHCALEKGCLMTTWKQTAKLHISAPKPDDQSRPPQSHSVERLRIRAAKCQPDAAINRSKMQLPTASPLCVDCSVHRRVFTPHARTSPTLHLARKQRCQSRRQAQRLCRAAHSDASTKSLKETAALDQLIDLFLEAKSQQQVTQTNAQLHHVSLPVAVAISLRSAGG